MLPTIGLIVATYAIARLLQVPLENSSTTKATGWLAIISGAAILVIGFLAVDLLLSGLTFPTER